MDRAGTRMIRRFCGRSAGVLAGAVAALILTIPGAALAWHAKQSYAPGVDPPSLQFLNWDAVNAANPTAPQLVCTSCHTLNDTEGDQNTAHLIASSRNLNSIRAANGGTTPASLGCVYCHNTDINNKMHGVLSHFQSTGSKHPVGRNFVTGAETDREYLSSYLTTSTTELECLDCHEVTLVAPVPGPQGNGYVNHADSDDAVPLPANNPYMLKNVTVAGEYDNFCRSCHGSTQAANYKGSGKDIRLGVTVTVGGVPVPRHGDASAQTIQEDDGTNLRPTAAGGGDQCRRCHDTHYSGKSVLYNDGHEKHKEGAVEVADTAIVSLGDTSCTEVCHFPGDDDNYVSASDNNYMNHGHGMAQSTYKYAGVDINFTASGSNITMAMNCTSCHNAIDTSDVSGTRRRHVIAPTSGTIQKNYKDKFNLDNIPVQSSDTGSVYGNPLVGVCFQCHSSYETHKTKTVGLSIGCQDCHDEHGEGSGAGSNVFMIPLTGKPAGTYVTPTRAKPGAESIVYDTPRINPTTGNVDLNVQDFFGGATATGLCDSTECHGAPTSAKGYAPAAAFLNSGSHTGGIITTAGYDCATACHTHKGDSNGAWRAVDSCASNTAGCHGQTDTTIQPNGVPGVFPDRAGRHAEHINRIVALNAGTSTSDTTTCNWCHPNGAHSGNATTPAELMDGATYHFKTITGAADTGDTVTIGTSCNNVNCHYNTTVTIADWYNASLVVTCTYCHQTDGTYNAASNPLPNAHTKHVDEVADGGYNYDCTNCHLDNGANMAHQDGTLAGDVLFTVTAPPWGNDADEVVGGTGTGAVKYGTGAAAAYYTCAGVSCHGDFSGGNTANTPNWYNTVAAVGAAAADGRCGTCHGTTVGTDPMPIYADGAKGNKHPLHHTTEGYGCQVCHYATTTNGTTIPTPTPATHVNGAYTVDDDGIAPTLDSFTYTGTPNGTCTVTECHGGGSVNWNQAATPDITCDVCHGRVAGATTNLDANDFTRDGATMSKISNAEYVANGGGHGDNTAPNQPNKTCASCHNSAVAHDTTAALTGANPFRLVDQDGGTAGIQACGTAAGCHVSGINGPATGADISLFDTHSPAGMLTAGYTAIRTWPAFKPRCTECHDPHGDGTNLSMIQKELYDKGSSVAGVNTGAEQWGVPATTNDRNDLVFTDNATGASTGGLSFADLDLDYSSLCQECHEHASVVSFHDGATTTGTGGTASGANHPSTGANPGLCRTCHPHDGGFKPSGCAGCHGDGSSVYWPNTNGVTARTGYPNRNGRHLVHMDALAARRFAKTAATLTGTEQQTICGMCHNDAAGVGGGGHYPASYTNADAPADLNTAANQPFDQMWGAYAADANGAYTAATYGAGPTFAWSGGSTCANVDCHNSQTTAATYEWYGAGTGCLACHTKGGTNSATVANPASGLHNLTATNTTAHDEAFGSGGTCTTCHVTANISGHQNGAGLASGDFTAALVGLNMGTAIGNIGTYAEGTVGNLRGTCASTTSMLGTCHSDGGRWAREWSTDADADHRVNQTVTNAVCAVCHGTLNNWAAGLTVNHNLTNVNNGTHGNCEQCHVLPNSPYVWTTHHDLLETGVRYVETNSNAATAYAAATGNCNNTCHGNDAPHTMGGSAIWGNLGLAGLGPSCTGCHGYPPTSTTAHATGMTPVNHDKLRAGGNTANADVSAVHNECGYCHGVLNNATNDGFIAQSAAALGGNYTYDIVGNLDHKNGSVTMNGGPGAGYVAASGWCTTAACHGADPAHALASGAPAATLRNFGPGLCQTCHNDGGTSGAPQVPPTTALRHVNPAGATAPASEQCAACHTGHADAATPDVPQNAANRVEIRTRYSSPGIAVPTMNRQYSSHGYKIRLGGASATGSTEAEICWTCHANVGVSEWGTNTNTATGSMTYNYGSVSAPNWTTATWSPATLPNFRYKAAAIQSTHSANFDSGTATVTFTRIGVSSEAKDAVANIRCSYCHDVHDTRPPGTGETATDVNGQPYLRGNWRGNPYLEDGAPFSSSTYGNTARYGAVPRGGTQFTQNGGYYIDQNTPAANTPTGRGWTAMQYGGLCEKCHGNNDNTFSSAEIDGLDWRPSENFWTSANGHANSVKDGSGTGAANIFDFSHGRITPANAAGKATTNKYGMGLKSQTGSRGYGYRGTSSSGGGYLPVYQTATAFQSYNWGASVDGTTTQVGFHSFSCSKCHNPHASRLPKLLITNCLDINHNTWDNAKGSANTYYTSSEDSTSPYNTDAYWMSAQNCHRASDSTAAKTRTPGWNKVSPWGGSW